MREDNMKAMFLNAINNGRVRADAINSRVKDIMGVIENASEAINSIYPDATLKTRVDGTGLLFTISVFLSVKDDLVSRRVMDVEINKSNIDNFYVSWKEGKNPISDIGEFAEIFSHLFSSPTFLIGIEDMINSTK